MAEAFFDIRPTDETQRIFEVFADMSPRFIHATRQTLYRMGKIFYNDARQSTKFGPRSGVMAPLFGERYIRAKLPGSKTKTPMRQRSAAGEPPQLFSGFLRDSLGFNVVGMTVLHVRDDAPYAGWVEDGTRRMAPRPFLKPAITTWSPLFPSIGQEEMDKAMRPRL